jgi:PAS domain S-box-containing protein
VPGWHLAWWKGNMGSASTFRILLLERREETAQRLIREMASALGGIAHEVVTAQNAGAAGQAGGFDLVLCAARELARVPLVSVPIVTYRCTDQNQFVLLAAEGSACPLGNEPHEQEVDLLPFIACLAKQGHPEERPSLHTPLAEPRESRYRSFFANSLAGGFWSTPDGEILEANQATARMFGYGSVEELKGTEAWPLYAEPEDRWNLLERLRREGQVAGVEIKGKRKNGEPAYMLANLLLCATEEGGTPVVEGTLLDITERYRLQQQLTQVQKWRPSDSWPAALRMTSIIC